MRMNQFNYLVDCRYLSMVLLVFVTVSVGFCESVTKGDQANAKVVDFVAFHKALKASEDASAMSLGNLIFSRLERKYGSDPGFGTLKSKLVAAEFLGKRMESQLRKTTNKHLLSITSDAFSYRIKNDDRDSLLSVAPAKSFYEESVTLFSNPVRIGNLAGEEKGFLAQYYDLKLRILISEIARAGQALAIAEPTFKGTHNYVLVLPLLHTSDRKPFNINILPRWMRNSEHLSIFSDSCLLHFGLPFHAMMVAKESARIQNGLFSEIDFYKLAAKKCSKEQPHIAANSLDKAIEWVPDENHEEIVALQFEKVQLWLDSKNYVLAAGQGRKIFETYPNHKKAGKAIWLYYYALSRSNNTDVLLADIDNALADKRCESDRVRLMYLKWWALRKQRNKAAMAAAIEYELLKQYGNDPIIAPILLSRSTDLMASADYDSAYELLTQLIEKFPSTKTATVARKMMGKLEKDKGIR